MTGAIAKLRDNLKSALQTFSTEDQVAGQLQALWSLDNLLRELGITARLRAPLLSVIGSLTDAERRGAEKPLVESVKMIYAAVTLDNLMKAGMKKDEAANKVARLAGPGISADRVINYRENLHRKRAPQWAVIRYWEAVRCSKRTWGHLSKGERIRESLAGFQQTVVPAKKP